MTDIPLSAHALLRRMCGRRRVPLLHDSVEWYSASEFALGFASPSFLRKTALNRYILGGNVRVIAISRFLEEHFLSRGLIAGRIPAILDVTSVEPGDRSEDQRLKLVYSGSPGRKDRLTEFCRALAQIEGARDKARVDFFGVTQQELARSGVDQATLSRLDGVLTCHGRVSREDALRHVSEADFTILFRNGSERYARAGFPTKVVESLASGTPVLLNTTSDLGEYLTDGQEAIVCTDASVSAIKEGIERVLASSSPQSLSRMSAAARARALESFDYRVYRGELLRLLEGSPA